MTLLILGAAGQIGSELMRRAGSRAIGLDRSACDVTDAAAVKRALARADLSAVVNCAGYTAVDRAESERERAFAVNATAAGVVARAAADRALPVIHLSTDYVYAGTKEGAYREDDPVAPLNAYGASKAAGDAAVAEANPAHLILRVSWVFGVNGPNFVKTMLRLGRERRELRIVDDQRGGPTEARDIADAVLVLTEACRRPGFKDWGIYHFTGAPATSWHGFARAIFAAEGGASPVLVPISSRDYPTAATRPLNSLLDCRKIARVFNIAQPDWRMALARVLDQLARQQP